MIRRRYKHTRFFLSNKKSTGVSYKLCPIFMFRGKVILFNSFSYEIPFAVSGYLKTFSSYGEELCKD